MSLKRPCLTKDSVLEYSCKQLKKTVSNSLRFPYDAEKSDVFSLVFRL